MRFFQYLISIRYCLQKLVERLLIVVLSVHDKDEGAATPKDDIRVKCGVKEIQLAREIPNLKLKERTIGYI